MKKSDLFWANFGRSIAWGILAAIIVAVVDGIRFSWTNFGPRDVFAFLGACTLLFGLIGTAIGINAVNADESRFSRRT